MDNYNEIGLIFVMINVVLVALSFLFNKADVVNEVKWLSVVMTMQEVQMTGSRRKEGRGCRYSSHMY